MNLRLQQFINAENITQSEFADTIGVARGSISHILSGRNKPSFDLIEKMASCFPALNVEWLITGKGKMYKTHSGVPQEGDLFPLEDEAAEVQEEHKKPVVTSTVRSNLSKLSTLSKRIQSPRGQRNISRILVFYDDGTFQELIQDNS